MKLYRLNSKFYISNNYRPDTESLTRIQKLGELIVSGRKKIISYALSSGLKWRADNSLFGGYWADSAGDIYRAI